MSLSTLVSTLDDDGDDLGQCKLLGPFALFIQAALGAIALLSLVYKRWREKPRRPLKVFLFDASKQVVGTALLHILNLAMSIFPNDKNGKELSSSVSADAAVSAIASAAVAAVSAQQTATENDPYIPNPCSWYLLNLAVDTTIGIPILIGFLKLLHAGFRLTPLARPPESIDSGNYGRPPRYRWWMKQCLIYFLGLMGMKVCVYILFQLLPWLVRVGDWALRWTEGNEALQIAFSMMIFPLMMNMLQYYIVDSIIKKKNVDEESEEGDHDDGEGEEGNENHEHRGLLSSHQDGEEHDDIDDEEDKKKTKKDPNAAVVAKNEPSSSSSSSTPRPEGRPKEQGDHDPDQDRDGEHEEDKDLIKKVPKPMVTE